MQLDGREIGGNGAPLDDAQALAAPCLSQSNISVSALSPQFIAACSKFGADIFLTRDHILSGLDHGHAPTYLDVHRFWRDAICFAGDFAKSGTDPWLSTAIENIRKETGRWVSEVENGNGALTPEVEERARSFFDRIVEDYSAIHWKTVLRHFPAAKEMGILLLDFDTRLLGVPQQPLREVAELHNHLLIDPSKKIPQEGFLRVIPAEELFEIGQKRQSRLIGVLKNNEVRAFALLTLNNESVVEILGSYYGELQDANVISNDDMVGWVHLVGSSHEGRFSLAKKGLTLYSLITPLMKEISLAEGVNVLLGCVREGENANTAIKAHFRHGWGLTDCTYEGSDGVTPYRIIVNKIAPSAPTIEREVVGFARFGEAPLNDDALSYKKIEKANKIDDAEVLRVCENYFREYGEAITVRLAIGERLYVRMGHMTGNAGRYEVFQQIIPYLDQWSLLSNGAKGTLEELLPQAKKGLGLVYSREARWYE